MCVWQSTGATVSVAGEEFGAAAARGPGFGFLTIPEVAVEVEGVFAGTAVCAVFFDCEEELLRSEVPTSAEGLELVAEVGDRGSAVSCVEADGAASVGGGGFGPFTTPVDEAQVKQRRHRGKRSRLCAPFTDDATTAAPKEDAGPVMVTEVTMIQL